MNRILMFLAAGALALQAAPSASFKRDALPFLEQYCFDCHDAETKKGELALDELTEVTPESFGIWKRVWEQVALKEMPPKKKKKQPDAKERLRLANWIADGLELAMKEKGGFNTHLLPAKETISITICCSGNCRRILSPRPRLPVSGGFIRRSTLSGSTSSLTRSQTTTRKPLAYVLAEITYRGTIRVR